MKGAKAGLSGCAREVPDIYELSLKKGGAMHLYLHYSTSSSLVTGLEGHRGFQEVKVKVKQSRYRPGVAQRVPGS
jgi:hypothetical protein